MMVIYLIVLIVQSLLESFRLMEHYTSIVGETSLLLLVAAAPLVTNNVAMGRCCGDNRAT